MTNDADKIPENAVWPPPPTFRPDVEKPPRQIVPLWVILAINLGGSLLYCGYHAWHLWHTHRKIDWFWDVAFTGLLLFCLNTAFQIGLRYWLRRKAGASIS